jgi:hypothetical protein
LLHSSYFLTHYCSYYFLDTACKSCKFCTLKSWPQQLLKDIIVKKHILGYVQEAADLVIFYTDCENEIRILHNLQWFWKLTFLISFKMPDSVVKTVHAIRCVHVELLVKQMPFHINWSKVLCRWLPHGQDIFALITLLRAATGWILCSLNLCSQKTIYLQVCIYLNILSLS